MHNTLSVCIIIYTSFVVAIMILGLLTIEAKKKVVMMVLSLCFLFVYSVQNQTHIWNAKRILPERDNNSSVQLELSWCFFNSPFGSISADFWSKFSCDLKTPW